MNFFGLHWLDALILVVYIVGVLVLGKILARRARGKGETDFFLAGRTLGKWFQFFLNFGNMTDPSVAATTASSVYQEGAGGVWLGLIPLFLTPYYWFMNVWFRRVRLTTIADLFEDRFGGHLLATLYSLTNILMTIALIGFGNVVAFKTLEPIMTKSESAYTAAEGRAVRDYQEFTRLRQAKEHGALGPADTGRYEVLRALDEREAIRPYISWLHPATFYAASTVLISIFIMLGGLRASALVDALQAVLVITMSLILIPFGLARIGGPAGLHRILPSAMFDVFGSGNRSEYSFSSVAAFLLVSFVGITAAPGNMIISGSAKDEYAARVGAIAGGFGKRFMTIAWCICGLIAAALLGPRLADPDQAWGLLTRTLLPVGLIGLMIVGILGGKLAYLGANSVILSALVVKNLYEPLRPGRSERHYLIVARAAIPAVLILGVAVALYLHSAVELLKLLIALNVAWGAPILLIFLWRRITGAAVLIQVVATILLIGVIPLVISGTPSLRRAPALTILTRAPGIDPVSVYFEHGVAPVDPRDSASPREGLGRFNLEVYLVARLGVDVAGFEPATLLTVRYLVDGLLPLALLLGLSLVTRPAEPGRVARFYARTKTPIAPTPEADAQAVRESYAQPDRFEHCKLAPGSDWEFTKWNRQDAVGFFACGVFVLVILGLFKTVMLVGG